jgi:biopolymer transport protein ExbD
MARARGRGRRELKSEINIVPLLDVLLVLLLIFMATARRSLPRAWKSICRMRQNHRR